MGEQPDKQGPTAGGGILQGLRQRIPDLLFVSIQLAVLGYLISISTTQGDHGRWLQGISTQLEQVDQRTFRLEGHLIGGVGEQPVPTTLGAVTFRYDESGPFFSPANAELRPYIADEFLTWSSRTGILDVPGVTVDVWKGGLESAYTEVYGSICDVPETAVYTALQASRSDYEACPSCMACAIYFAYPLFAGELAGTGFVLPRQSPLRSPLAVWLSDPNTVTIFQLVSGP